jgi:sigma-B regulation protein RsbU (phosphoserine phosphatase)
MQTADDGTFRRVNRLFCQWLGYAPETLIGRRRFQDLLTMGGRIFHQTHWVPLLQMQGSVSEVKLDLVHQDGSTITMVLNARCRTEDGVVLHELAAFVARDRDRYERELLTSRKRLEELVSETTRLHEEAKDRALFAEQMIGIVSHDLRNPLSGIDLGAALLATEDLSEAQRRTLARIRRSTGRANRLVDDLLDFTKARFGHGLSVDRKPIDLHETVSHALEELEVAYPGRALQHVRLGQGLCRADPNRLGQVVGNLVSNAMVYGQPAAPIVVTSSIDASTASLAVHNDGAPIPPDAQGRLFEPMTRGADSKGAGRSVGLGLYIVRQIAEAHGGSASVRSSPDEGTTFTVSFPEE